MKNSFFFLLMSFWINCSFAYGDDYYISNPKTLQEAVTQCPEKKPKSISCEQLNSLALRLNALSIELRNNPQAYGFKVLALQELLAQQAGKIKQNKGQVALMADYEANLLSLHERLAIIKWLESPESK